MKKFFALTFVLLGSLTSQAWGLTVDSKLEDSLATVDKYRQELAQLMEAATIYISTYDQDGDKYANGSGFLIGDGYILTNNHVIENDENGGVVNYVTVTNPLLPETEAQVMARVSSDEFSVDDLALLHFSPPPGVQLPILKFNPKSFRLERVSSWGFPGVVADFDSSEDGEGGVVSTEGVISTIIRDSEGNKQIVHSALISGGNSGGPLINMRGEVIGINTWKAIDDFGPSGNMVNGAIPAESAILFLRNIGFEPQVVEAASRSENNPASSPQNVSPPAADDDISEALAPPQQPDHQDGDTDTDADDGVDTKNLCATTMEELANWRNLNERAQQGDPTALAEAGTTYLFGDECLGVAIDEKRGLDFLQNGAAQDDSLSMLSLAAWYIYLADEPQVNDGLELLRKVAQGDENAAEAQAELSVLYSSGRFYGVKPNFTTSFQYAVIAAKEDEAKAAAQLAYLYYFGYGTPQNKEKALLWATKAYELDDDSLTAMTILGCFYLLETDISNLEQNKKLGLEMLIWAAENYDVTALGVLGKYYYDEYKKDGKEETLEIARYYADQAATYADPQGLLLMSEIMKEESQAEAYAYLRLALSGLGQDEDEIKKSTKNFKLSPQGLQEAQKMEQEYYSFWNLEQ